MSHDQDISAVSAKQPVVVGRQKFGTFAGVFTPTLLTILGVIMYLRTGWVVGNAGILGALGIIMLAFGITIATGLSMASITTNIRIGAGGAYSIISQSLGIEVGGSVGIPLFLSQALAVAMYVFGFREGWHWIFPEHPALLVDLGMFGMVLGIALVSTSFAFRVQYFIMAVIAASLLSVAAAAATGSMQYDLTNVGLVGPFVGAPEDNFGGTSFWVVFAVFFPAATGIMAGANMSGDLKDPRRSIPVGTMAAIAVSLVIYLVLTYWLARSATPEELVSNYTIMIERAYWGPAVVAGLLGATFSSALASIVGAPRVLQALGEHAILPRGRWLAQRTPAGDPRHALYVTAGIVLIGLLLRDLNTIAPLITMFFLITYAMINFVVFVEGRLGLVSFRPAFSIPQSVPLLGLAGCLLAMFVVNPAFGLVAVVIVVAVYWLLIRRKIEAPYGDLRSGLFVAVAEWGAKRVGEMPGQQTRAWKPNLLVPVEDVNLLRGHFSMVESLAYPKGSVKLVGLNTGSAARGLDRLPTLSYAFRRRGVFSSWTIIDTDDYGVGLVTSMQALRGAFFRPNVLFLPMPARSMEGVAEREACYRHAIEEALKQSTGTVVYAPHPTAGLAQRQQINVWIHDRSPDWSISMDIGNLDLMLLIAFKLKRNWEGGRIRLISVVEEEKDQDAAQTFLKRLIELARLPGAEPHVVTAPFREYVMHAPRADINIFGLQPDADFDFMRVIVRATGSTALFIRDSGHESALA